MSTTNFFFGKGKHDDVMKMDIFCIFTKIIGNFGIKSALSKINDLYRFASRLNTMEDRISKLWSSQEKEKRRYRREHQKYVRH